MATCLKWYPLFLYAKILQLILLKLSLLSHHHKLSLSFILFPALFLNPFSPSLLHSIPPPAFLLPLAVSSPSFISFFTSKIPPSTLQTWSGCYNRPSPRSTHLVKIVQHSLERKKHTQTHNHTVSTEGWHSWGCLRNAKWAVVVWHQKRSC